MTTRTWRWAILGVSLGIYLLGLGFIGEILTERVRFDRRRIAVLNRYDELVRTWQAYRLTRKQTSAPGREGRDARWTTHLRRVEDALAQRNVSAAEMAWLDAFVVALKSRRWDGMVEVGDAYLRLGRLGGFPTTAEAKARRIYQAALFRARQQDSVDGVLRAADAFAALGDREVVERGLRIAEGLATQSRDAHAVERVRAVAKRLAAGFPGPESVSSSLTTENAHALLE